MVRNSRVCFILLDDMDINVVKVVFVGVIGSESVALGVAEGVGLEVLVGGTKEATINI